MPLYHHIPAYCKMNYQIETDIESLFMREKDHLKEKRKIEILILHPHYKFDKIKNIDLDMIGSKLIYAFLQQNPS